MGIRIRTLLIILIIFSLVGLSGLEAYNLIGGMFHHRSPLKNIPPTIGEPINPPLTNKVVLVLMDALREDTAFNLRIMPTLNKIRHEGAWASMTSRPPSFSAPGYATILTGAWPDINDGPAFNLEYGEIPTITQTTMFSVAQLSGLKTALSGYYWFEELVSQETVDYSFYTPGEDRDADRQVMDAALPWVSDPSINLILIHIDQIDYAGHYEGGAKSNSWDEAASRSDRLLDEIAMHMDLAQSTLLVFSDHGQIDQGGHGGHDTITLHEPFIASGKGIIPGAYGTIQMVDIAPTVAVLLGTSLPSSSEGKPLIDMLDLTPIQIEGVDQIYANQQAQLITSYKNALLPALSETEMGVIPSASDSIAGVQKYLLEHGRFLRSAIIVLMLGLIAFLIYQRRSPPLLWMLIVAIFYILVFYLNLTLVDGYPLSFSIINDPFTTILIILGNTLVAFLIGSIILWFAVKQFVKPPTKFATLSLGYTALSILLSSLPALYYFALFGLSIGLVIPDVGLLFLCLLALTQVMVISISGLLQTGLAFVLSIKILHKHT